MKELCGHAANHFLVESGDGTKLMPQVELILLTSEPTYQPSVGGFERTRILENFRCASGPDQMRKFAAELMKLADEADQIGARVWLEPPAPEA